MGLLVGAVQLVELPPQQLDFPVQLLNVLLLLLYLPNIPLPLHPQLVHQVLSLRLQVALLTLVTLQLSFVYLALFLHRVWVLPSQPYDLRIFLH